MWNHLVWKSFSKRITCIMSPCCLITLTTIMSQLVNCCSTLMLVITSSCTLKHFNLRLSFILLHSQWCHPLFSLHWFYIPQWVRTDRVSGWISVQMACLCFRLLYSSVDVERPLTSTWVSEIWGDGSEGIQPDSINGADGQAPHSKQEMSTVWIV